MAFQLDFTFVRRERKILQPLRFGVWIFLRPHVQSGTNWWRLALPKGPNKIRSPFFTWRHKQNQSSKRNDFSMLPLSSYSTKVPLECHSNSGPTTVTTTASPRTLCPVNFGTHWMDKIAWPEQVTSWFEEMFSNNSALGSRPVCDCHGHVTSHPVSKLDAVTLGVCSAWVVHGSSCRRLQNSVRVIMACLLYSDSVIQWFVPLPFRTLSAAMCYHLSH
jgi:hypothetical protein